MFFLIKGNWKYAAVLCRRHLERHLLDPDFSAQWLAAGLGHPSVDASHRYGWNRPGLYELNLRNEKSHKN